MSDEVTAYCELKCKVEGRKFSESAVKGPINNARMQLPKSKCGIVFLKLPMEWHIPDYSERIAKVVESALRTTNRIAEIVIHQRALRQSEESIRYNVRWAELIKDSSPYASIPDEGILSGALSKRPNNWVEFAEFRSRADFERVIGLHPGEE